MARTKKENGSSSSTATIGFEAKLWLTADKLRNTLFASSPSRLEGERAWVRGSSHRSVDLLGRGYEYFLTHFASAEGTNGGQFSTPSCVMRCLVEPVPVRKALAPCKGRIYERLFASSVCLLPKWPKRVHPNKPTRIAFTGTIR